MSRLSAVQHADYDTAESQTLRDVSPDELNTDTRLIGRSVWNTEWLLVIPGTTLLADPEVGIERFMQDVDDIYLYFQTYAYAGTAVAASAQAKVEAKAKTASTSTSASSSALPLPDVLFYGTVARNNEPLTAGTVKAILPRGAVVSVDVAPIQGTNYTYALTVPLSQYNPDLGAYAADSARPREAIRFLVNDAPATFRDANGATTDQFIIPANGVGQPYRLDPALIGTDSYPLGRRQRQRPAQLGRRAADPQIRRRPDRRRHQLPARPGQDLPAAV